MVVGPGVVAVAMSLTLNQLLAWRIRGATSTSERSSLHATACAHDVRYTLTQPLYHAAASMSVGIDELHPDLPPSSLGMVETGPGIPEACCQGNRR